MADTKISAETSAGALDGSEIVPVVRGTGSPPTYSNLRTTTQDIADLGGGGGALTLVSTLTANNTADNLAWTGLTGNAYLLVVENLVPATNGAVIKVELGEGGTPTYQTSGYAIAYTYVGVDVVATGISRTISAAQIAIVGDVVSNTTGTVFAIVRFNGLSQAKRHAAEFSSMWQNSGDSKYYEVRGSGVFLTDTNAITAIRLITSAGNLSSGRASLYQFSG